jgi:hydrogenase expression/formation protein HypC
MCLAVPAEIVGITERSSPRMGTVDFGGVRSSVCLEWVPEAKPGDFVIVHVGFAISVLDREEAEKTLSLLGEAFTGDGREDLRDAIR